MAAKAGSVFKIVLDEHWDFEDEGEYQQADPVNVFAGNAEDAVEAAKMMAVSKKIAANKKEKTEACECLSAVLHSCVHVCDVDTCAVIADEHE